MNMEMRIWEIWSGEKRKKTGKERSESKTKKKKRRDSVSLRWFIAWPVSAGQVYELDLDECFLSLLFVFLFVFLTYGIESSSCVDAVPAVTGLTRITQKRLKTCTADKRFLALIGDSLEFICNHTATCQHSPRESAQCFPHSHAPAYPSVAAEAAFFAP